MGVGFKMNGNHTMKQVYTGNIAVFTAVLLGT